MPNYVDTMAQAFQDELEKIASAAEGVGKHLKGALAPAVGGVALWEMARRANNDRQLGAQIRKQQGM